MTTGNKEDEEIDIYIKFKNICLIFKNWKNSCLIFINDIIDINCNIRRIYIWKVKKANFFTEFTKLKKAFPNEWCLNFIKEESIKTSVHVKRGACTCIWNGNNVETAVLTNKNCKEK